MLSKVEAQNFPGYLRNNVQTSQMAADRRQLLRNKSDIIERETLRTHATFVRYDRRS